MSQHTTQRPRVPLYLLIACVLVVAVWVIAATRALPFGVPGEWVWQPQLLAPLPLTGEAAAALMASLVLATAITALALVAPQLGRTQAAIALLALTATSLSLSLALVSMEPPRSDALRVLWGDDPWHRPARERLVLNLGLIMFSDVAFGYQSEATRISDVGAFLRGYEDRIRDPLTPQRVQTHPPGAVLLMWLLREGTFRTDLHEVVPLTIGPRHLDNVVPLLRWPDGAPTGEQECSAALVAAFVLIVCGSCLCVPTYLLARQMGNRNRALMAAAVTAFLPSALLFVPGIDQLVALLGAFALWLFCLGARRRRVELTVGAGVLLALDSFISIGAASLALLAAGVALAPAAIAWRHSQKRREALRRATMAIGALAAGMLVPLALLWPLAGYNALEVALTAAAQQRAIIVDQWQRGYLAWLLLNPVDFAVFLGPAVAMCAASWLIVRWRHWRAGGRALRSDFLLLALAITLALVDLSGSARAEVGRIWMLFMPYVCIFAARRASHYQQAHAALFAFIIIVLQILHAVFLQEHVDVMTPQ